MNCPICGQEMRKGYLFTTKDGAFSFANEVPSIMKNARTADGFTEITHIKVGGRVYVEAYCCDACRLMQFRY